MLITPIYCVSWNYFENQVNHVKKLCKLRKHYTKVRLLAAHGHIIYNGWEFFFSCSFLSLPHTAAGAEKGHAFRDLGWIVGLRYALCPLILKHCSSTVEMIEGSPRKLNSIKLMLNMAFVHLWSRYLIIFLNTCTFSIFMYFS